MKSVILSSIFLLTGICESKGQDAWVDLQASWKEVTRQIQRRNDVANLLLHELMQTQSLDSSLLLKAKENSYALTAFIDSSGTLDSQTVGEVSLRNYRFGVGMGRALMQLEHHSDIRRLELIRDLMLHLLGTEERLKIIIDDYNKRAEAYDRRNLIYIEPAQKVKAISG